MEPVAPTPPLPTLQALDNLRMRLLDLSARNRLLNFRHTDKAGLRVIDELPDALVARLLDDGVLRFKPIPEPGASELLARRYLCRRDDGTLQRLRPPPDATTWAQELGYATDYELPPAATDGPAPARHTDNAIQTLLYPHELEQRLKSLLQTATTAIEEQGHNILYLACGFLDWYESDSSDTVRSAPLFLLPVLLQRGALDPRSQRHEYTIRHSGEDILANLSLSEKLRQEFGLVLPEIDDPAAPDAWLEQVRAQVAAPRPRWQVRRQIALALLNFGTQLMYRDLDPANWPDGARLSDHPVVSRMLSGAAADSGSDAASGGSLAAPREHAIDALADVHQRYPLIDDADSSQHSALIDALDGRSLVIEGPPGTGKSQTITNLIAAALAQGKSVLFVAEKMAALDVVRRRLDRAGLGEFCLELHSHATHKSRLLDDIRERLRTQGKRRPPDEIAADIARLEALQNTLHDHAARINAPWQATGLSCHAIFMAAARWRAEIAPLDPADWHPAQCDGERYDATTRRALADQLAVYCRVHEGVAAQVGAGAPLDRHPWHGVRSDTLEFADTARVLKALQGWQDSLHALVTLRATLAGQFGVAADEVFDTPAAAAELLAELKALPALAGDELPASLALLSGDVLHKAQRYLELFELIEDEQAALLPQVGASVLANLDSSDTLLAAGASLVAHVAPNTTLGELARALNALERLATDIDALQAPLGALANALGPDAAARLDSSADGLDDCRALIELAASLAPDAWEQRSVRFDHDELDQVLPVLRHELSALQRDRDTLSALFALDRVPEAEFLHELAADLARGGTLGWLKSDWREARSELLGYAARPRTSFAALAEQLDALITFRTQCAALDAQPRYHAAFGPLLHGLDTDIDRLEHLRDWYRRVRARYGIGFGPRVALGEALLHLPIEVAPGLRSLATRGLPERIAALLARVRELHPIFAPVAALAEGSTPLGGAGGVLAQLAARLRVAVQAAMPLLGDDTLTIATLAQRLDALRTLRRHIGIWQRADFDRRLFGNQLGLRPSPLTDNTAGLARLRHTLQLAQHLDSAVHAPVLRNGLRRLDSLAGHVALREAAAPLAATLAALPSSDERFAPQVELDRAAWTQHCGEQLDALIARNQQALDQPTALSSWLDYVRVRTALAPLGLGRLAEGVDAGALAIERIEAVWQAAFHDRLARDILLAERELAHFSGLSQEALQARFRTYDERLKTLQREQIAWRIDQRRVPLGRRGTRVSELSERALLEHEAGKKSRHLPIRQLLGRASQALQALKPCFMMGPMSVAQYLAPGRLQFDLVVMDEASQIKPQDALGTLARGRQLVVVGDPRQLPPTSFFDRLNDSDDDGDPDLLGTAESILDAALPLLPTRRLRWHYRSQHESLIAFSNHAFYGGDLVVFPSPHAQTAKYGVQYVRVAGGSFVNRRNIEEARQIAEAVRAHFANRPDESIGVVAMSSEQREQIGRALEALARDDAQFRAHLEADRSRHDALFVKNLENVQGDERDVICISLTYGPREAGGPVPQRFGPVNADAGWRRLNVLLTRAKKRMQVFSSLASDDIVIGATSSRGVRALRDFLAFCETGIVHQTRHHTAREPDSDFEIAVMQALAVAGFECQPQVGVAGYFIDLAVRDPGQPGRYLMAIECDGARYHSARSVRDRDRLRQAVLERLGWTVRRIWSTDWFKNPQGVLAPLIDELRALQAAHATADATASARTDDAESTATAHAQPFDAGALPLAEALERFDVEVIRPALPDTPAAARLLRADLRAALLEHLPTHEDEFLAHIPFYLRAATAPEEMAWLEQVFTLIDQTREGETAQALESSEA